MIRVFGDILNRLVSDNSFTDYFGTVTYDDFLRRARTGDILLAASKELSAIPARIYSDEPWTHVGLVARIKRTGSEELTVVEFSGHNPSEEIYKVNADVNDRRMVLGDGVGLYDLDDFYTNNSGIYWRPLEGATARDRTRISETIKLLLTSNEQKFCSTAEVIAASLFGGCFGGGVLCSTVVAIALHNAGVIQLQKEVSRYLPCDFASDLGWNLEKPPVKPLYVLGYETRIF